MMICDLCNVEIAGIKMIVNHCRDYKDVENKYLEEIFKAKMYIAKSVWSKFWIKNGFYSYEQFVYPDSSNNEFKFCSDKCYAEWTEYFNKIAAKKIADILCEDKE